MIRRNDLRGRRAPEWAQAALAKFGTNPYGEPNFRVIWRPSRTKIIGGFFADTGRFEYRRVLKYGRDPKWCLERWRPAYMYGTAESWKFNTLTPEGLYAIGPYPAHGEYESCEVFSTEKGLSGYVPLEPGLIELTARAVVMGKINSYSDIRIAQRDEQLAIEAEQDREFDEMWNERQMTRPGLTIGAGGAFNKEQEIEDYARRIERAGAFVPSKDFRPGFGQFEEN
jgi:hypothetical protein